MQAESLQISVVIPLYDRIEFLSRCLDSVIIQPEVSEIIVIDDGSDNTYQRQILQILKKYPSVRYLRLNDHRGPAAARNYGLRYASFPWIAFLDDDDTYLPDRFTVASRMAFENLEINMILYMVSNSFSVNPNNKEIPDLSDINTPFPHPLLSFYQIATGIFIPHLNGLLVRRELVDQINGFDENLIHGEDTDFLLRLALKSKIHTSTSNDPVAIRFIHGNNLSLDQQRKYYRLKFLRKWISYSLKNRKSIFSFPHFLRSYLAEHPHISGLDNPLKRLLAKCRLILQLSGSHGL